MILLTTATQTPSSLSSINPLAMLITIQVFLIIYGLITTHSMIFFLLDITDHYPIFTIAPINCPKRRIRVKFRDHSGQNLAKLKFEVEHYLKNHVQINQDVSANTNNFCNNLFVIYSQCCPIKKKEIYFKRLRKPWISDASMVSLNRKYELFRQYKNGIVTFDHYDSFKNNFTTTLRHARNNYFQRKFTECSNNARDTWKT